MHKNNIFEEFHPRLYFSIGKKRKVVQENEENIICHSES